MSALGEYFVIGIIAAIAVLNILASFFVLRAYFIIKERRWYQLALVWFLPLLGSSLVIYIQNEDFFKRKRNTVGNDPNYTGRSESWRI